MNGRDDPRADAVAETERVADGNHWLTNHQIIGFAKLERWQRYIAMHFQQSQVGVGIGADQFRRQFAAVGQFNRDLPGAINNVIISDHISIAMNNEPAAERTRGNAHRLSKILPEGIKAHRVDALVHQLGG